MTGGGIASVVWILLALMLVGSAVAARRIPLGRSLTIAATWIAIFAVVYGIFSFMEPRVIAWQQARRGGTVTKPSTSGAAENMRTAGPELRIPLAADGHYWVDATVNGRTVRFLIDSGASITALSQDTADTLGLPPDPMKAEVLLTTANGRIAARRSIVSAMDVGGIAVNDLPVVISPAFGDVNVLGMNFLGKLDSWRVERGTMILTP